LKTSVTELYKTQGAAGIVKGVERYINWHIPLISQYIYAPLAIRQIRSIKSDCITGASVDYITTRCYSLIQSIQVRSEILNLLSVIRIQKPKTILEIGTAMGGTLFLLARNAPAGCQIISVDLPNGPFGGGYPEWKILLYESFALPNQTMLLLRYDSHSKITHRMVEVATPHGIDFLFIDGDHTYEGVKKDFEMYSPLVNPGGIIAFHDITKHPKETGCDVHRFWNEVKQKYQHEEFIENPNQIGYGIGVLYK
jgi:predicted O-methyltransferase YrrM